jgi:hypothetical protein
MLSDLAIEAEWGRGGVMVFERGLRAVQSQLQERAGLAREKLVCLAQALQGRVSLKV